MAFSAARLTIFKLFQTSCLFFLRQFENILTRPFSPVNKPVSAKLRNIELLHVLSVLGYNREQGASVSNSVVVPLFHTLELFAHL